MGVRHETIAVERSFAAPLSRVFSAWSDDAALTRWYLPGDQGWTSSIAEHEFTVGGRLRLSFGMTGDAPYQEDARYEDIVPAERIVYSMRVSTSEGPITASLVTVEFVASGEATSVKMTEQIAILDGADSAGDRESGWREVLDNLAKEVGSA